MGDIDARLHHFSRVLLDAAKRVTDADWSQLLLCILIVTACLYLDCRLDRIHDSLRLIEHICLRA